MRGDAGRVAIPEGSGNTASGANSHAEGVSTTAGGTATHTEGSSTSASSANAHAEGYQSSAQASASHAEGNSTTASGAASHSEGQGTLAQATNSHAEGNGSQANGQISHAQGFQALTSRFGQHAQAGGQFTTPGDAQTSVYVAHRETTSATPAVLFFDGGTTATLVTEGTNVLTVVTNTAYKFRVSVVARRTDVSGDTAGWDFTGLIGRGSTGNSAVFVGTPTAAAWGAAGAAAWDVTLTIDSNNATNNYLKITVTGEASKTIRWVARIETVEVA